MLLPRTANAAAAAKAADLRVASSYHQHQVNAFLEKAGTKKFSHRQDLAPIAVEMQCNALNCVLVDAHNPQHACRDLFSRPLVNMQLASSSRVAPARLSASCKSLTPHAVFRVGISRSPVCRAVEEQQQQSAETETGVWGSACLWARERLSIGVVPW